MDLIAQLPIDVIATNHVAEEIIDIYEDQNERYRQAIATGIVEEVELDSDEEVELFAQLTESGRIGVGECSAIACAVCRGHSLAIDDRRATTQAKQVEASLTIIRTQDLVVEMIQRGILTVGEADAIKADWEQNHRFTLKFGSFSELL